MRKASKPIMPATARIEPTLRSMPPRRIGKAWPTARIPMWEKPTRMFSRLPVVRKLPEKNEKIATVTRKNNTSSRLGSLVQIFMIAPALGSRFGHGKERGDGDAAPRSRRDLTQVGGYQRW